MNPEQKKLIEDTQAKLKELKRILPGAQKLYADAAKRQNISANTARLLSELRMLLDSAERSFETLINELRALAPEDFIVNSPLTRFFELKGRIPGTHALVGRVSELVKRIKWNLENDREHFAEPAPIATVPPSGGHAPALSVNTTFDVRRPHGS